MRVHRSRRVMVCPVLSLMPPSPKQNATIDSADGEPLTTVIRLVPVTVIYAINIVRSSLTSVRGGFFSFNPPPHGRHHRPPFGPPRTPPPGRHHVPLFGPPRTR